MAVVDFLLCVCVCEYDSSRLFIIQIEFNDIFIAKNIVNKAQHEHNAWCCILLCCIVIEPPTPHSLSHSQWQPHLADWIWFVADKQIDNLFYSTFFLSFSYTLFCLSWLLLAANLISRIVAIRFVALCMLPACQHAHDMIYLLSFKLD